LFWRARKHSLIKKSIAVSFMGLILGIFGTIVPATADAPYYGAIAVSQSDDTVFGEAVDYDSDAAARKNALSECNKDGTTDCKIEVHFSKNRCGAVAASKTEIGYGLGDTKSEAADNATSQIQGGRLVDAACN
jgi:hypothetical protein